MFETMRRINWANSATVLLLFTWTASISQFRCVHGVGYQGANHFSKEADNSDSSSPVNYKFEYGVDDGAVGQQFGHEEERNGYQTRGRYSVLLPDGRLQIVTYTADKNGYKADITYETGSAFTNSQGYTSTAGYNNDEGGGFSYEKAETSYGPPQPHSSQPSSNSKNGKYEGKEFHRGRNNQMFGKSSSRSFVKLHQTVKGKPFSYMY